ncbi:MAG: hypothetical protein R3B48_00710 [Kofleriaceae bacterium]
MGRSALGVADRAARRWAPESPEEQPRGMRSLSFVDRMVAPWVTAAQRSAGLRMFSQYAAGDVPERATGGVSWVFPRPWFQDELDWIAASRAGSAGEDTFFTTRGTYASSSGSPRAATPQMELVAPSFSSFSSSSPSVGSSSAYSPLVSHSSISAASVVAQSMRSIQAAGALVRGLPMPAGAISSEPGAAPEPARPGLSALGPMIAALIPEDSAARFAVSPSAMALRAPSLVTPPSPRPERLGEAATLDDHAGQAAHQEREARAAAELVARQEQSRAVAQSFAQERARVVEELRLAARREQAQVTAPAPSAAPESAEVVAARAEIRREAERQELLRVEHARSAARVQASARQQARIDAIVAERVARLEAEQGIASAAPSSAAPSRAATAGASPMGASEPVELDAGAPSSKQALVQALRMAELLAHAAAVGPAAMAPAAGPRVALPAGLGGLVSGMSSASAVEHERSYAALVASSPSAPRVAARPMFSMARSLPELPAHAAPSGALPSIAARAPAALGHVAWSDRWLGRFAGASESALDAMSTVAMRARLAPDQLFVAPALSAPAAALASMEHDPGRDRAIVTPARPVLVPDVASRAAIPTPSSPSSVSAPTPVAAPPRFADDEVVPDEIFAAIAAGALHRPPAAVTAAGSAVAAPGAPAAQASAAAPRRRASAADLAAVTAPSAPADAGLSASLASSPIAPALGHVLSLPRAVVFDPRALDGASLASAFLSGAIQAPMVAQRSFSPSAMAFDDDVGLPASAWRQWSAEFVRPATWSPRGVTAQGPVDAAGGAADLRASAAQAATTQAQTQAAQARAAQAQATSSASSAAQAAQATSAAQAALTAQPTPTSEDIITLRSTLLSPASPMQARLATTLGTLSGWTGEAPMSTLPTAYQTLGELLAQVAAGAPEDPSAEAAARFEHRLPVVLWPSLGAPSVASDVRAEGAEPLASARPTTFAQPGARERWYPSMPDYVSGPPELGEVARPADDAERGPLFPGMVAQRALGFGAVQSSQSADLSFDFVPPELVLAARVYGFGASEAAQAARLAMGGSAGLSAMAGAIDLRFVSMMAPRGARPGSADGAVSTTGSADLAAPAPAPAVAQDAPFGVAPRAPRGAFLLPAASVAAMGLSAATPDGEHAMPIAALEILAAKMVAELGSFASPVAPERGDRGEFTGRGPVSAGVEPSSAAPRVAAEAANPGGERELFASAAASVTGPRRARFEALYLALSQSSEGGSLSPAVRAARALALANRDEEAPLLSSRERAALAWQIFPVVLSGEGSASSAAASIATQASRAERRAPELEALTAPEPSARPAGEMRPGLSPLSSRAGEALGSFVTSTSADARPRTEEPRAGWRSGRYGGGEVEIPGWFEAAARKMFEDRGDVEGISLADLTLIAAAPPTQIAASGRDAQVVASPPKQASPDAKSGEKEEKVDIEKVASEVYRAVVQLMDSARMRNGEPYL